MTSAVYAGEGMAHAWPTGQGTGRAHDSLGDLLALIGALPAHEHLTDTLAVECRTLRKGASLFHEGGDATRVYVVRTGTLRLYRTGEDGYEQVLGFLGRGDLLGFDALGQGRYPNAASALEDCTLYAVTPSQLEQLQQQVPRFTHALYARLSRQLAQLGDIVDLMAAVAAEARLARFLLQTSARMRDCGQSPTRLLLRMSRRDIASHLGLALETVSRTFTTLADAGTLSVDNREVVLHDLEALRRIARGTRYRTRRESVASQVRVPAAFTRATGQALPA